MQKTRSVRLTRYDTLQKWEAASYNIRVCTWRWDLGRGPLPIAGGGDPSQ